MTELKFDVNEVARAIDFPVSKWPGRCFGVASAMVQAGLVYGDVIYGTWVGDIHPKSLFAKRVMTHHGWIEVDDGDTIVDPTRWAFEMVDPYVYVGPSGPEDGCHDFEGDEEGMCQCDHADEEHRAYGFFRPCLIGDPYDAGSNRTRAAMLSPLPPSVGAEAELFLSGGDLMMAKALLRRGRDEPLMMDQVRWLANLPPEMLGSLCQPLYRALDKADLRAFVPIDNWRAMMK